MKVSKSALTGMLAFAVLATVATAAADAQRGIRETQRERERQKQREGQPTQPQAQIGQLNREESAAIAPLFEAVRAQNWAGATAALPAAQAGAVSPYAKYVVAQLHYEIARNPANDAMQLEAITAMLNSGGAPQDQLQALLGNQIQFLLRANNLAAAEPALVRYLEIDPNNTARLRQLAEVRVNLNKRSEAAADYARLIQISEAAGQKPEDLVYRQVFALAIEARDAARAATAGRAWLQAYPTPENWRAVLVSYRQQHQADAPLQLDARRFMRAARLLREAGEYVAFADSLNRTGNVGEVKAVLTEGIAARALQAADADARTLMRAADARIAEDRASLPRQRTAALAAATGREARQTGDAFYGYGQYAEAAELYRAALQKGGEDPNLVNIRLGASLALAGQRPAAEAAFQAVTTGPRAQLAQYWLLWLATRSAA